MTDNRQPADPTRELRYSLAKANGLYMATSTQQITWFWRENGVNHYIRPNGEVVLI